MLEVGDRVLELQLNVFAVEPMVLRRGGEEVDVEERPGEVECGKRRTAARGFWRCRDDRMVNLERSRRPQRERRAGRDRGCSRCLPSCS